MRVSAKKNDPGYVKNPFDYKVFLNGIEIQDCFTADEEQGIAYIYKRDYRKIGRILPGVFNKHLGCYEPLEGFVRGHVVVINREQ